MQFGAIMFVTDYAMAPPAFAQALEARGFDSLWCPEHSHIPTSRLSPWPGGADLPQVYYDTLDPFITLTAAAVATERLKLCTGICLVVQRDPIHLAKEVASLDYISGGRFIFGIGGGWNAEEMADHGTAFKTRFKLMGERIEAMKRIWTQDRADYQGQFVDFPEMISRPKPVQKPHPPIIVGGGFPYGARRAVAYGDGWMPIAGRGDDLLHQIPQFRQMAEDAGRDPGALEITVFAAPPDPQALAKLRDAGCARALFIVPSEGADIVLPHLDRCAAVMQEIA